MPIATLVSFLPIYFWAYVYLLPREIRLLLDGGFYSAITFELVTACAACGLIARLSAYQIAPASRRFASTNRELRFPWMKPVHTAIKFVAPFLKNDAQLTVGIFCIALTGYFLGLFAILFVLLYSFALLSAFGSAEKIMLMSQGEVDVEEIGDFQLGIRRLSVTTFREMVGRHLGFLSMVILAVPFCLGFGRFVSLIGNDDVALVINSSAVQSKLIASTDTGLLFMASADAKVLRLIAWRPTDYFLLMPNGQVVCFGERNTFCAP